MHSGYVPEVHDSPYGWTYDERDDTGRLVAFVTYQVPPGEPRPEHLRDVPAHWREVKRRPAPGSLFRPGTP